MFIHCKMKSNSLTLTLLTTCALKMLFAVLWFSLMTRDHNDKLYTLQPVESVQLAYIERRIFLAAKFVQTLLLVNGTLIE